MSSGNCGIDGQSSVYTRLAYYYDWMKSIINYDNETIATITNINDEKVSTTYQCNKMNASCGCGYSDVEINPSRIVTGEDAIEASWTMFVSLRMLNSNKHICGGTLLSNLYVLTAAHCIKSFSSVDFSNLTIVAGITNQFDSVRYVRNILRIYIHPNFTNQDNKFINDIAILELDYRLLIDSNPLLSKICVPSVHSTNQYQINNTQLVNIGWDTVASEQSTELKILQQIKVFTIDNDHPNCSNLIKDVERQFCAGIYEDRKG
jgi:transmembrane serine protease 11D